MLNALRQAISPTANTDRSSPSSEPKGSELVMSKVPSTNAGSHFSVGRKSETKLRARPTVHLPVAKEEANKIVVWREDVVVVEAVGFLGRLRGVVRAVFEECRASWSEGDEESKGESTR